MKHIALKDQPLLEILQELFPDSSNRTLKNWIKEKRILIDQKIAKKPLDLIREGQEIFLDKKQKKHHFFYILYEDLYYVVIDKPSGLLSVPSEAGHEINALELLQEKYKLPIYAVHRLDKHASGLLMFAKNKKAKEAAIGLFSDKAIERHYLAICEGRIPDEQGIWNKPLFELPNYDVVYDPKKGVAATTHFKVYRRSEQFSYLYVTLDTGKKHQIRVHCKEAGHPICGDLRYGSFLSPLGRLCLHAIKLCFKHPFLKKTISLRSRIPPSFYRLGAEIGLESIEQKQPES